MQNENFISQLKNLYKDAFPIDSASFVEYFFNRQIKTESLSNVATVSNDNQLVSAGYIIKKPAIIFNRQETAYYLTALATFSEFRGKGYFNELIQKMLNNLYDREVPFCFLYPFNHEFYLKYGFNTISFCDKVVLAGGKKCVETLYQANSQISSDVISRLVGLEREIWKSDINKRNNKLVFGREELQQKIAEYAVDNIGLYTYGYTQEVNSIFAYCFKNNEKVFFYGVQEKDRESFFHLEYFKGLKIFDFGGDNMPYIQARVVNIKSALEKVPIIGTKQISIKIIDNIMAENNGVFLVMPNKDRSGNIVKRIDSEKTDYSFEIGDLTKLLLCGNGVVVAKQRNVFIDQY